MIEGGGGNIAVGERERRELQEALVGAIGPEQTDTLFGYLPPTGWGEVATKRDLDALHAELRTELAQLRAEVQASLNKQLRWTFTMIVAVLLAVLGTGIFA